MRFGKYLMNILKKTVEIYREMLKKLLIFSGPFEGNSENINLMIFQRNTEKMYKYFLKVS